MTADMSEDELHGVIVSVLADGQTHSSKNIATVAMGFRATRHDRKAYIDMIMRVSRVCARMYDVGDIERVQSGQRWRYYSEVSA